MAPPDPLLQARTQVAQRLEAFRSLFDRDEPARGMILSVTYLIRALNGFRKQLYAQVNESDPFDVGAFRCLHCGELYHEDYMVLNSVWREAVPDQAERYQTLADQGLPKMGLYLHLRCLEARLGRRVMVADLSPAPINNAVRYFLEGFISPPTAP